MRIWRPFGTRLLQRTAEGGAWVEIAGFDKARDAARAALAMRAMQLLLDVNSGDRDVADVLAESAALSEQFRKLE